VGRSILICQYRSGKSSFRSKPKKRQRQVSIARKTQKDFRALRFDSTSALYTGSLFASFIQKRKENYENYRPHLRAPSRKLVFAKTATRCANDFHFWRDAGHYRCRFSESMRIVISLSEAPTDNGRHQISRFGRRLVPTAKFAQWQGHAIAEVRAQRRGKMLVPTFESPLVYRIKVYMKNKRTDHTNYLKGVQDVLKHAGIIKDDKFVCPQFEPCDIDAKNPRVEITI